jgi:hypothetical protein
MTVHVLYKGRDMDRQSKVSLFMCKAFVRMRIMDTAIMIHE